jgi:hypothetical protein
MLLLNIFVTPLYMKSIGIPMTSADVVAMIPKILLRIFLHPTVGKIPFYG